MPIPHGGATPILLADSVSRQRPYIKDLDNPLYINHLLNSLPKRSSIIDSSFSASIRVKMLFSKSISAVAALAMALTSLAAAMPAALEERATSGFTLVEADPNVRVATKDNTINGTSVHNDAVAAPGPSTPFSMTFDNNAQFYNTAPQDIFVVVTATDLNGAAFFLHPNGTVYYPPNPSASQGNVPVTEDIQIKLNPKGQLTNVKLPVYAVGGRVYYSLGQLSFYTNHGSTGTSIVAPSFTSPSDQNINSIYSFLEFSYHSDDAGGYFTNLSYVDIVSLLASQTLLGTDGSSCSVEGAQLNTTRAICSVYQALDQQDGTQLSKSCQIDTKSNQLVRVLSLEHLLELPSQSGDLANYYTDYVNQVYNHYQTNTLTVTEGSNTYTARTDSSGNNLVFNTGDSFAKP